MCYSALVKRDLKYLAESFGAIWTREQIEEYDDKSDKVPKLFPPLSARIFPGNYAPVAYKNSLQERVTALMRYSVDPPDFIPEPGRYTTFNARRDNLTSKFWSEAFGKHHGAIILEAFFEWVEVKDLLKANVVKLSKIEEEFAKQALDRKERLERAGKKYKPTKTELTDPRFRKIIIEFRPSDSQEMYVPVIFSVTKARMGFAIITHDPPPEIEIAGHDRCPIVLTKEGIDAWLSERNRPADRYFEILDMMQKQVFTHDLPPAIAV